MMDSPTAYRVIVGLVLMNDWDIFDEVARKHPSDFPPSKLPVYREIGKTIAELVDNYDFSKSLAFERSVAGRSAAYVETKRRFAAEPVKSRAHRETFTQALRELPSSDSAFDLLPLEKHSLLNRIRQILSELQTGV